MTTDPRHSAFRRAIEESAQAAIDSGTGPCKPNCHEGSAQAIRAIPNPFPEEAEPQESDPYEAVLAAGEAVCRICESARIHVCVGCRALSPAQDETEEKPQPSPGINPSTTEKQTP